MSTDPSIRDQTYQYFLMEAPELLQTIEADLLSLVENRSSAKVHNLMRMTHTLKGAAASVGLDSIKTVAHYLEDVFKALYNPAAVIDAELEALLFQGYECLRLPLTAEFTHTPIDESELLNRAASVFAELQGKLGDFFNQEAQIPTSAELGFDITESIFDTGVKERLDALAAALVNPEPAQVATILNEQAMVFVGLAESLGLPGFGAIAQATLNALAAHPDQSINIAQLALVDLRAGRAAVMGGDRARGGEPSAALLQMGDRDQVATPLTPFDGLSDFTLTDAGAGLSLELSDLLLDDTTGLDTVLGGVDLQTTGIDSTPLNPDAPDLATVLGQGDFEGVGELAPTELSLEDMLAAPGELLEAEPLTNGDARNPAPASPSLNWLDASAGAGVAAGNISLEQLLGGSPTSSLSVDGPMDLLTLANAKPIPIASPSIVAVPPAKSQQSAAPTQMVRVDLEKLQQLNYLAGELLTAQNRQIDADEQMLEIVQKLQQQLWQHRQNLLQIRDWLDQRLVRADRREAAQQIQAPKKQRRQKKASGALWSGFDDMELDAYGDIHVRLQSALEETVQLEESTEAISLFRQRASQILERQQRLLTNVRDDLMTARMLPAGELFNRFPRVLQQLVSVHRKPAELKLSGTDVLIDKSMADKLYDPILHLVRNGFDHGLETPEIRRQRGKPEVGQLRLHAYQQDRWTYIAVSDDGKGLDFEKVFDRALEMCLLRPEDADTLTEAKLLEFLFEPGFSTASKVSDISGRGIGLDVVRTQIESLQGKITVKTEPQKGTTFLLQLPLDLNVARVLVCQAGSQVYAFLAESITQIILPQPDQIQFWQDQRVLHWQHDHSEQLVPLRPLSELIPYTNPLPTDQTLPAAHMPGQSRPILLLGRGSELLGLEIDQVIGEQELVIRPVGVMVVPPPYILGCCILGDGRLTLLIDTAAFMAPPAAVSADRPLSFRPNTSSPASPGASPPAIPSATVSQILAVDDSITLRQNLALVLQKAGYQVFQARDGEEAIAQLQKHPTIRLVICDVEMPGMNGFEFLSRRSQTPDLAKTPVVMLTSRSSDKHRQIAMELGANGYLTKPYLDQELLDKVASLIQNPAV
jgi:chemotaxis protein histidine kinase CheA